MAEEKESKTEEPTARRLTKAREQGQVARSMEINTLAVLMTGLFVIFFSGSFIYHQLADIMTKTMAVAGQISMEGADLLPFLTDKIKQMALILAPVFLGVALAGLLVNLLQVGPLFTTKTLEPKLNKLNPISGFKKILISRRSLMELFKSITKIAIVGLTAYLTIRSELADILLLGDMEISQATYFVLITAFKLFLYTCWAFGVLALLDLLFQRWQHHQEMKMTKQEVKDEYKQAEGDPKVKARIRSLQREAAQKRMMSDVPKADVVITNPTHLALALLYQVEQHEAPVVVAKGQNLVAEKIRKIAQEHDVPIMEDKPLAQALYKAVEVGQIIPVMFYQAVAEILAYVYRLKGKGVHGQSSR